ncbi:MAG: hypothetical protein ABIG90_00570 [bacterium]
MIFSNNHLQKPVALLLILVILANISLNILIRPKKAEALGPSSFLTAVTTVGKFIWAVVKEMKDIAYLAAKDLLEQKLANTEWWKAKIANSILSASKKFTTQFLDANVDALTGIIEGDPNAPNLSMYIKNQGDYIREAGSAAGAKFITTFVGSDKICKPLQNPIKELALSLSPHQRYDVEQFYKEAECTLGDIENNLEGFYENFEGGWDSWLKITQPQNNFYGMYLLTIDAQNVQVAKAEEEAIREFETSGGWKSTKQCMEWSNPDLVRTFIRQVNTLVELEGKIAEAETKFPVIEFMALQMLWPSDETINSINGLDNFYCRKVRNTFRKEFLKETYDVVDLATIDMFQKCGVINTSECTANWPNNLNLCTFGTENEIALLKNIGFVCTREEVLTPGSSVGEFATDDYKRAVQENLKLVEEYLSTEGKKGELTAAGAAAYLLPPEKVEAYTKALANASYNRIIKEGLRAFSWGFDKLTPDEEEELSIDPCAQFKDNPQLRQACETYQENRLAQDAGIDEIMSDTENRSKYTTITLLQKAIDIKRQQRDELKGLGITAAEVTNKILDELKKLAKCQWKVCLNQEKTMCEEMKELADEEACEVRYCGTDKKCEDDENKTCETICKSDDKFPGWSERATEECDSCGKLCKLEKDYILEGVNSYCSDYAIGADCTAEGVLDTSDDCAYKSHPAGIPYDSTGVCLWDEKKKTCTGEGTTNPTITGQPANPEARCFGNGDWQKTIIKIQATLTNRPYRAMGGKVQKPSWAENKLVELEEEIGSIQMSPEFNKPYSMINMEDIINLQDNDSWMGWNLDDEIWNNIGTLRQQQWLVYYTALSMKYEQEILDEMKTIYEISLDKLNDKLKTGDLGLELSLEAQIYWEKVLKRMSKLYREDAKPIPDINEIYPHWVYDEKGNRVLEQGVIQIKICTETAGCYDWKVEQKFEKIIKQSKEFAIKYKTEAERLVDLGAEEQLLQDYKRISSSKAAQEEIKQVKDNLEFCKCIKNGDDLTDKKCGMSY